MGFFKRKVSDWLCEELSTADISPANAEAVFKQTAIKELALYTAIGLIADIVCECERQVYREGKRVRDANWYAWNVSANQNQSASDLITRWIFDIYYSPNGGLVVPVKNSLYNATTFGAEEHWTGQHVFRAVNIGPEPVGDLTAKEVFHVQMVDEYGRSVVQLINRAFDNYADLLTAASTSYTKGSGEKYALTLDRLPSGTAEDQAKYMAAIRKNLSAFASGESGGYPLTKDQTLTKLSGTSSSASSYADIRKDVYSIVAEALHLPASLLDGNMNNTAEVVNQALTFAIGPLCDRIGRELTRKTFTREGILKGSRIILDTTQIRVHDVVEVSDKLDKLIASGIMCIDEARGQCNLEPLNTDWSTAHYITKNYGDVAQEPKHLRGGESE